MEYITLEDAKKILYELNLIMSEQKDALIQLDSIMGDGDLGITMNKIFTAAYENMKEIENISLGKFFAQAGMIMAKAAPSTMGTLIAGAFMTAGKSLGDKLEWDVSDLVAFYQGLAQGIMNRGKAKIGEKTIVDVLYPVGEFLHEQHYKTIKEVVTASVIKSKECLQLTKELVAQHGRAAYYQEKSKGHQDAGATVAVFIFDGFKRALS